MNLNRTIINYLMLAVFAFVFDKIYAIFGHGVASPWMSDMYLFLLGSGTFAFLLIRIFIPDIVSHKGYRLFYNIYNSGIAMFTNGMLLYGILEIAGGTSNIVPWFLYTGSGLIAIAVVMFCRVAAGKAPQRMKDKAYGREDIICRKFS